MRSDRAVPGRRGSLAAAGRRGGGGGGRTCAYTAAGALMTPSVVAMPVPTPAMPSALPEGGGSGREARGGRGLRGGRGGSRGRGRRGGRWGSSRAGRRSEGGCGGWAARPHPCARCSGWPGTRWRRCTAPRTTGRRPGGEGGGRAARAVGGWRGGLGRCHEVTRGGPGARWPGAAHPRPKPASPAPHPLDTPKALATQAPHLGQAGRVAVRQQAAQHVAAHQRGGCADGWVAVGRRLEGGWAAVRAAATGARTAAVRRPRSAAPQASSSQAPRAPRSPGPPFPLSLTTAHLVNLKP
jgi:hypothetical protein